MTATDLATAPGARDRPLSESALRLPAAALRTFIASYSGYRQAGVPPARHAGLPSPYLTVIFTLDEPLTIAAHPDPAQPGGDFVTLAGGLHTSPALVTHEGYQSGIQVALSPLGARALLGLPASELVSLDIEATEVCGALAAEIQQRIQAAAAWPDRFAVLDQALSARLHASQANGRHEVSADLAGLRRARPGRQPLVVRHLPRRAPAVRLTPPDSACPQRHRTGFSHPPHFGHVSVRQNGLKAARLWLIRVQSRLAGVMNNGPGLADAGGAGRVRFRQGLDGFVWKVYELIKPLAGTGTQRRPQSDSGGGRS
jgi:uncharacterized protein DUF6597